MSDSGRPLKKSTMKHLDPRCCPVGSYHRGVGVWMGSFPEIASSSRHSLSRSLSNTPVSGGGSDRSTNVSSDPSAQRTVASADRRL